MPGSVYRPTRILEVSHRLDVPTLHTIGMLRRAKLPIRVRMVMRVSRQAQMSSAGNRGGRQQRIGDRVGVVEAITGFIGEAVHAAVQGVQRLRHSVSGQSTHVDRRGLLKKFRDIAGRHGVLF